MGVLILQLIFVFGILFILTILYLGFTKIYYSGDNTTSAVKVYGDYSEKVAEKIVNKIPSIKNKKYGELLSTSISRLNEDYFRKVYSVELDEKEKKLAELGFVNSKEYTKPLSDIEKYDKDMYDRYSFEYIPKSILDSVEYFETTIPEYKFNIPLKSLEKIENHEFIKNLVLEKNGKYIKTRIKYDELLDYIKSYVSYKWDKLYELDDDSSGMFFPTEDFVRDYKYSGVDDVKNIKHGFYLRLDDKYINKKIIIYRELDIKDDGLSEFDDFKSPTVETICLEETKDGYIIIDSWTDKD